MRGIKNILLVIGIVMAVLIALVVSAVSTRHFWQKDWVPPDRDVDLRSKWPVLSASDVPPDSAFDFLRRAADAESKVTKPADVYKELNRLNLEPWSDQSFPALAKMLNESGEALNLARSAATAANPQVPTYTSPFDRFDYIGPLMRLNDVFQASAARNVAAGNLPAAFNDLDTAIADAQILSRGGVLIHALVDIACEMKISRAMRLIALQQNLAPDVAHRATDQLVARSAAAEPLAETFRQEARVVPTLVQILYKSSKPKLLAVGNDPRAAASERRIRLLMRYCGSFFGSSPDEVSADLTRVYKGLVASASEPYNATKMERLDTLIPKLDPHDWVFRRDPVGYIVARITLPAFDRVIPRYYRRAVELNATAVVIALRQFQQIEHRTPAALAELVPNYLATVPMDSFDGKPLRYRVGADGKWVIYSVGPNQLDEGGVQTKSDPRKYIDVGDVVFSQTDLKSERARLKAKNKGS